MLSVVGDESDTELAPLPDMFLSSMMYNISLRPWRWGIFCQAPPPPGRARQHHAAARRPTARNPVALVERHELDAVHCVGPVEQAVAHPPDDVVANRPDAGGVGQNGCKCGQERFSTPGLSLPASSPPILILS